jgi:hypothetical protein
VRLPDIDLPVPAARAALPLHARVHRLLRDTLDSGGAQALAWVTYVNDGPQTLGAGAFERDLRQFGGIRIDWPGTS